MFRRSLAVLGFAVLTSPGIVQAAPEAADIVNHPFSAEFASGGKLRVHVRSGEVRILGTDQQTVSVELSGRKALEARDLKVRFDRKGGGADLGIWGGPRNDITITIRIPKDTDLYARVPFGDLTIENVTGNKDVSLHAGELTIEVGDSADYSRVNASVTTGDLDGQPFGESHSGLFRSFHKDGGGKYRLYAHVGAGELTLK